VRPSPPPPCTSRSGHTSTVTRTSDSVVRAHVTAQCHRHCAADERRRPVDRPVAAKLPSPADRARLALRRAHHAHARAPPTWPRGGHTQVRPHHAARPGASSAGLAAASTGSGSHRPGVVRLDTRPATLPPGVVPTPHWSVRAVPQARARRSLTCARRSLASA
jgi:hypothetical protein